MRKIYSLSIALMVLFMFSTNLHALAIVGSSSGVFINPGGPSGMVVTGVGTSNFTWGVGSPPSSLSFGVTAVNTETETVFSFGTLTYFNGTITSGTQADNVDLDVLFSLTTPAGVNQNFIYTLGLINTPNTGTANQNADIVQFQTTFPSSSFTAGGEHFTLEFLGVGTITGSGFSTINQFFVLEGASASAQLLGRVTATNPIPEPSTLILLGTGFIGLVGYNYRRKKLTT